MAGPQASSPEPSDSFYIPIHFHPHPSSSHIPSPQHLQVLLCTAVGNHSNRERPGYRIRGVLVHQCGRTCAKVVKAQEQRERGGEVPVSVHGRVHVGGKPAGVDVRLNGPVCDSMCDPPSSCQPALAHTWASLHLDSGGSRLEGRVERHTACGNRRGFWSELCCRISKFLSPLWVSVSPCLTPAC